MSCPLACGGASVRIRFRNEVDMKSKRLPLHALAPVCCLSALCLSCGGTTEEAPSSTPADDAGAEAGCHVDCAPPPSGCHYEGASSCDPPKCPILVCEDASAEAGCALACAPPPAGCHFDGKPTCDPPACPPVVCEDASVDAGCAIDCAPPPAGCHFEGEPTCDPPTCPPVVCEDAGAFPYNLDGIWLLGWSGGLNHFSWVRFTVDGMAGGAAQYNAGADLAYNAPLWSCNGAGTWMLTAKPDTVGFNFPPSCTDGFQAYTFLSFQAPSSSFPKGAILEATVEAPTMPGQTFNAYKFPDSQCDAAMTKCTDPLQ